MFTVVNYLWRVVSFHQSVWQCKWWWGLIESIFSIKQAYSVSFKYSPLQLCIYGIRVWENRMFKLRKAHYTQKHTQTTTHNKSKNSVWTGGSHVTLVREEERESVRWREREKEQVSGVIGSFLNKHAQKSGSVFITAYERGLCACMCVCVRVWSEGGGRCEPIVPLWLVQICRFVLLPKMKETDR